MPPFAVWWLIEDKMPEMFDVDRATRYDRAEDIFKAGKREAEKHAAMEAEAR